MEFYSTMLHEISHSTMTPERLNREMGGRFGDPKYAKEELVAELTAAMISHSMGFDSKVTDNSAAYLDSWISVLKQEPKFIVSVMADVNKSSEMILDHVDKQRLALNEQPYLTKNDPFAPLGENEEVP
ncbi:DNA primase, partial [gut metagenome]